MEMTGAGFSAEFMQESEMNMFETESKDKQVRIPAHNSFGTFEFVNAKFLNLINRRGGRTETKSAQSF
jgi:hypothetical protein